MTLEECDDRLIAVLHERIGHYVDDEAFVDLVHALQSVQDETAAEYAALVDEERRQALKALSETTNRLAASEYFVSRYTEAFSEVASLALKIDLILRRSRFVQFLFRWGSSPAEKHVKALAPVLARVEAGQIPPLEAVPGLLFSPSQPQSKKAVKKQLVDAAAAITLKLESLS